MCSGSRITLYAAVLCPRSRISAAEVGFREGEKILRRRGDVGSAYPTTDDGCKPVLTDLRWLGRWRLRRTLVSDGLADTGGGGVEKVAHPKVAHVGLDGMQAAGNERQECGRVVRIEGHDLGVVSRRDEEAETKGESEDNLADEANIPHARPRPCNAVGYRWRGRL